MKSIGDFASSRIKALVKALKKYHQFQDEESLHRIRVEIKKLKTTLLLVGFADKKFDAHETYLTLRNIFRKAGQIRQPGVMIELMMAFGVEGLPVERLGDPARARTKFLADIPFYLVEVKGFRKQMRNRWKVVRRKDISRFVSKRQRMSKRVFVPAFKPSQLHLARKRFKEIIYVSRLSKDVKKKDVRFCRSMEAAIGKLHDHQVLLDFLRSLPKAKASVEFGLLKRRIVADKKSIRTTASKYYRKG